MQFLRVCPSVLGFLTKTSGLRKRPINNCVSGVTIWTYRTRRILSGGLRHVEMVGLECVSDPVACAGRSTATGRVAQDSRWEEKDQNMKWPIGPTGMPRVGLQTDYCSRKNQELGDQKCGFGMKGVYLRGEDPHWTVGPTKNKRLQGDHCDGAGILSSECFECQPSLRKIFPRMTAGGCDVPS
jgi:hypothetical protein